MSRVDRLLHRAGVLRLHTDHLDAGVKRLDVGRDAGNQSAAADRAEDRVDLVTVRRLVLMEDFHRDDHIWVIEGVNKNKVPLALQARRAVR